jgi:mannosyl-3-phosphoglycerate phosphatase
MKSHISKSAIDPSKLMVVTDLDGTLLDFENYTYEPAKPALRLLRKLGVPVICCSSKTSREIEYWRKKLGLLTPFIAENGAAVFLPADQFGGLRGEFIRRGQYLVRELGPARSKLRTVFEKVRREMRVGITGFSDMDTPTVKSLCGFATIQQAKIAADREYSEPFVFPRQIEDKTISDVLARFEEYQLKVIRGRRFFHLVGDINKGRAVEFLKCMCSEIGQAREQTIGIGDSTNDLEMLNAVDFPVLVMAKNRRYNADVKTRIDPILAGAVGPKGWNRAIEMLVSDQI